MSLLLLANVAFADVNQKVEEKKPEVVVLTDDNSVVLRDAVTQDSVSQLQIQLLRLASQLREDEPIYIVLDTPGGSVFAGEALIETLKGIKQPVHSITLFAASMGFQIAQATDVRYITENGISMSHRAQVTVDGQINGELETRLAMIKTATSKMEYRAASRMGISLKNYQDLIVNELWGHGYSAIAKKMADRPIIVSCDKRMLDQTIMQRIQTFFGPIDLKFSRCPLISAPLYDGNSEAYLEAQKREYVNLLYNNKVEFVNRYIRTGRFN